MDEIADSADFGMEETVEETVKSATTLPDNLGGLDETFTTCGKRQFVFASAKWIGDSRNEAGVSGYALLSKVIWGESYRERFERLKREWKEDTKHLSSPIERARHPAYEAIIGMGIPAVPLMLEDLRNGVEHWFWALKTITDVDPTDPAHQGNLEKMAADWVDWGKRKGFLENEFLSKHKYLDESAGEGISETKKQGLPYY
jgi:hypothetical protein